MKGARQRMDNRRRSLGARGVLSSAPMRTPTTLRTLAVPALLALVACGDGASAPAKPSASAAAARPATTVPPALQTATKPAEPTKQRDCGSGPDVTFDDPVWEKAIRFQLQKEEGSVPRTELAKVKTLNVSESKKNDALDACIVPFLTGVKGLYLAPGNLEDISMLAKLHNVESLRLSVTKVKDLTPLQNMKKLDRLDLGRTSVADLKPLASLGNLTELQLDSTEVEDLSPLAGMTKLEVLDIKNTRVKDLSPLRDMKALKTLRIGGSRVEDISPVKGLPKLKIDQAP